MQLHVLYQIYEITYVGDDAVPVFYIRPELDATTVPQNQVEVVIREWMIMKHLQTLIQIGYS